MSGSAKRTGTVAEGKAKGAQKVTPVSAATDTSSSEVEEEEEVTVETGPVKRPLTTEDHGTALLTILAEIRSSGERQTMLWQQSNERQVALMQQQAADFRAAGERQAAALEQQSQLMAMLIQRLAEPSQTSARPVTDLPLPQVSTPAPSSPDVETPPVSSAANRVGLVGGANQLQQVEPNPRPQTLDLTPTAVEVAQQPFRGTGQVNVGTLANFTGNGDDVDSWLQNMEAVAKLAGWTPSNHALQIRLHLRDAAASWVNTLSDTVPMDPQLLSKHLRKTFLMFRSEVD
jgi:hypothetical protein